MNFSILGKKTICQNKTKTCKDPFFSSEFYSSLSVLLYFNQSFIFPLKCTQRQYLLEEGWDQVTQPQHMPRVKGHLPPSDPRIQPLSMQERIKPEDRVRGCYFFVIWILFYMMQTLLLVHVMSSNFLAKKLTVIIGTLNIYPQTSLNRER